MIVEERRWLGLTAEGWQKAIAPVVIGALTLGLWEAIVRHAGIPPYILPGPWLILRTLVADWGTLVGLAAGSRSRSPASRCWPPCWWAGCSSILFTQSKWLELSLFPYAIILQVTPIVAIAPLIIIWVDNTLLSLLICAWIVAFFPILSNTILGLNSADHNLVNLFQLYGASRWQTLRYLRLPAALPYFLGGLRISGGLALIGAVVAEFVAGSGGTRLRPRLPHPRSGLSAEDPAHVRRPRPGVAERHPDLPGAELDLPSAAAPLARKRRASRELISVRGGAPGRTLNQHFREETWGGAWAGLFTRLARPPPLLCP